MSHKHKRHYLSFDKLSIGYEDFLDLYANLQDQFAELPYYPPFNIKKIDEDSYVLELSVPGYVKGDLKVTLLGEILTVEAAGPVQKEEDFDDEYFYQGIYPGGALKAKFLVSPRLHVEKAEYADGVLEVFFLVSLEAQELNVPVGPFDQEVKPYVVEYDSAGAPIQVYEELVVDEDVPYVPAESAVVVNDHTDVVPTTEVVLPDVLPQVVEVSLEHVADEVDASSLEPQATIVVEPATFEVVSDDVHVEVIKTEEGKSDIVVAIPVEVKEELEAKGIDVVEAITAAMDKAPDLVLPDPVVVPEAVNEPTLVVVTDDAGEVKAEVSVPEVLPTIVEVKVEEPVLEHDSMGSPLEVGTPIITFEPVDHDIPEDHVLVPVVTADGSPDIVIAVSPETQEVLDSHNIDVVTDIAPAIVEADPVIATVDEPAPVMEVVEAPAAPLEVVVPAVVEEPVAVVEPVVEAPVEVVPEVVVEVEAPVLVEEPVVVELPVDEPVLVEPELAVEEVAAPVAVTESVVEVVPEPVLESVVVHQETDVVPTVEVQVPEVLPQIVEVSVEHLADEVVTDSEVPQAVLVLNDATHEVSDDVHVEVIKTEEGKSDVVVAIPLELKADLEAQGIDVMQDVADAIDKSVAEAPSLPEPVEATDVTVSVVDEAEQPKLEVTMPDVVPQVLELTVTDPVNEGVPAVTLENVSGDIPDTHVLIPVVTGEGQPDVMVAVDPDVKAELEAAGVDVAADVSAALVEADVAVVKTDQPAEPVAEQVVE